jgi:hypothetical protein
MAVKQLSDGHPDGVKLGQSVTDLVGLYGVTPVVQPTAAAQSAVPTTALTTLTDIVTTASVTGAFNSVAARVGALCTLVNQMRSDLIAVGVIKGS